MGDILRQAVADKVIEKVIELDGISIDIDPPQTIRVMARVENLSIQLTVKTPAGPRFFMVAVQEKY